MAWPIRSTPEFDEWFDGLDADAKTEVLAKVFLLREMGPNLRRPHADALTGSAYPNMRELHADVSTAGCVSLSRSIPPAPVFCWSAGPNKASTKGVFTNR